MRRHGLCPTCTCEDVLALWADSNLIPTPDTSVPMYEIARAFYNDHPHHGLTQKALTGRLRSMHGIGGRPYPIKQARNIAVLSGYTLRLIPTSLNLDNSAAT